MQPERRRMVLGLAGSMLASPLLAKTETKDQLVKALRHGGLVVIMRHGKTELGIGDPPNFTLGDCTTQRNLSILGRSESFALGRWFRESGVAFDAAYSSQWCRCIDTARAIRSGMGVELSVEPLVALNSFFSATEKSSGQTTFLRRRLREYRSSGNQLWISHQVNITALANYFPQMGEAVVLKPGGKEGFSILGTCTS